MNITTVREIGLALLLVLLQAILFNQIHLFGVAIPLVFIYIILRLPVALSTAWVLTISFFLGLVVDIFSNTPGMNALACTLLAFVRRPVFTLYLPHGNDYASEMPSLKEFGMWLYVRYALTMTFLYCLFLYVIESLTFFDPLFLILRILGSTLLTFVFILCIDSFGQRREKRL